MRISFFKNHHKFAPSMHALRLVDSHCW